MIDSSLSIKVIDQIFLIETIDAIFSNEVKDHSLLKEIIEPSLSNDAIDPSLSNVENISTIILDPTHQEYEDDEFIISQLDLSLYNTKKR